MAYAGKREIVDYGDVGKLFGTGSRDKKSENCTSYGPGGSG